MKRTLIPTTVTKSSIGLGNVDNTSDATKAAALDLHYGNPQAALLTAGEETMPRDCVASATASTTSGTLRLSFFTARKSETTTQVRVSSGSTAAGATPTLVRVGLYSVDGSGNGSLVASIASDTSIFAATNTAYTRSWSSSYAKVAGQRYALAVLVVTGATAPTLTGLNKASGTEDGVAPRLSGALTSQADLPASFTEAGLSASISRFYGVVLP